MEAHQTRQTAALVRAPVVIRGTSARQMLMNVRPSLLPAIMVTAQTQLVHTFAAALMVMRVQRVKLISMNVWKQIALMEQHVLIELPVTHVSVGMARVERVVKNVTLVIARGATLLVSQFIVHSVRMDIPSMMTDSVVCLL